VRLTVLLTGVSVPAEEELVNFTLATPPCSGSFSGKLESWKH
jgi:hypothetical protein